MSLSDKKRYSYRSCKARRNLNQVRVLLFDDVKAAIKELKEKCCIHKTGCNMCYWCKIIDHEAGPSLVDDHSPTEHPKGTRTAPADSVEEGKRDE